MKMRLRSNTRATGARSLLTTKMRLQAGGATSAGRRRPNDVGNGVIESEKAVVFLKAKYFSTFSKRNGHRFDTWPRQWAPNDLVVHLQIFMYIYWHSIISEYHNMHIVWETMAWLMHTVSRDYKPSFSQRLYIYKPSWYVIQRVLAVAFVTSLRILIDGASKCWIIHVAN